MNDLRINTARRTNFLKQRPEVGQFLIWDYYANGTTTCLVKVQALKKSCFIIDDNRRVNYEDGKVQGFDTAIVRHDPDEVKKHTRKMYEARLRYCDYELLPGKVLRRMNAILDEYEIEKKIIREQHAVAQHGDVGASRESFIAKSKEQPKPKYKIGSSLLDDKPIKKKKRRSRDD